MATASEDLDRLFVEQYDKLRFWLIAKVEGTPLSAEDILHTTYVKLRRSNPPQGFRLGYLFFAAHSVMIDAMRRSRWTVPLRGDRWVYDRIDERIFDLDDQLFTIFPRQRLVLEMFCGGYSHSEIADVLGITPQASKSLLVRARRHIGAVAEAPTTRIAEAV